MILKELKQLLEEKTDQYNTAEFIVNDPISIPHRLSKKEDIESLGFIIASIAWGNRSIILKSGENLLNITGHEPHAFITQSSPKEFKDLKFVHRTFNPVDLENFFTSLRRIYKSHGSLENAFGGKSFKGDVKNRIIHFRNLFIDSKFEKRSVKHISSPLSNSACKRINMYLRWMVRKDKRKVDFGIWNSISMSDLCVPLDVHTGRIARELGLISRTQNDWNTVEEMMQVLRKFDPKDPAKYDYALFGIGVNEK